MGRRVDGFTGILRRGSAARFVAGEFVFFAFFYYLFSVVVDDGAILPIVAMLGAFAVSVYAASMMLVVYDGRILLNDEIAASAFGVAIIHLIIVLIFLSDRIGSEGIWQYVCYAALLLLSKMAVGAAMYFMICRPMFCSGGFGGLVEIHDLLFHKSKRL